MKRSSKDSKEPATPGSARLQAAALPFRQRDRLEILLVSSLDTGRWIVPKGWPMKGRTIAQSALREAWEEAGVKGAIAPKPVGTFNYDKRRRNGAVLRCVVEVFPLEVKAQARTWPEKSARVLRWCDWAQAAELVDDAGLGDIIRTFAAAREPAMAN